MEYQGDEYGIYKDAPKKSRLPWVMAILALAGVAIGLFIFPARSEEGKMMMVRSAILCDTEAQIRQQIVVLNKANGGQPETVEGCGSLTQPVVAFVTPLGVYEDDEGMALLFTIEVPNMPKQYSFGGWRSKEKSSAI